MACVSNYISLFYVVVITYNYLNPNAGLAYLRRLVTIDTYLDYGYHFSMHMLSIRV